MLLARKAHFSATYLFIFIPHFELANVMKEVTSIPTNQIRTLVIIGSVTKCV